MDNAEILSRMDTGDLIAALAKRAQCMVLGYIGPSADENPNFRGCVYQLTGGPFEKSGMATMLDMMCKGEIQQMAKRMVQG